MLDGVDTKNTSPGCDPAGAGTSTARGWPDWSPLTVRRNAAPKANPSGRAIGRSAAEAGATSTSVPAGKTPGPTDTRSPTASLTMAPSAPTIAPEAIGTVIVSGATERCPAKIVVT